MALRLTIFALVLAAAQLRPAAARAQSAATAAPPPALAQTGGDSGGSRDLPLRRRRRPEPTAGFGIERIEAAARAKQNEKFEIRFTLAGGAATVPLWPYDPKSPNGVHGEEGVTAYATFRHESGAQWRQPAFLYQAFQHEVREGRDWIYPEADERWTVRFSPHLPGRWSYTLSAVERAGAVETDPRELEVEPSDSKGFIRVSRVDPRYFEYADGAPFYPIGIQSPELLGAPRTKAAPFYEQLTASGVTLVRMWISSLFGSAWTPYVGGRNQYRGYLPNAGLVTVAAAPDPEPQFAMMLDWDRDGDTGWFDACRLIGADSAEAVKPNTYYRVSAEYAAWDVKGPREMRTPEHGFVIKQGDPVGDCYQAGVGTPITSYGGRSESGVWSSISGVWESKDANFMPALQIGLENVTSGFVFVRSLSVRELNADGTLGPEVLSRPSMDMVSYVGPKSAYRMDGIVEMAEAAGVRLKLVVSEKNDEIWLKIADDGSFTTGEDNLDGYYGVGRQVNRTRWLQRAWWRYAQARWGYSPAIFSWELLNEGDPGLTAHFEMADEFGRYMKYGVFGLDAPETAAAAELHPNAHLTTTSFWQYFPCEAVWRNEEYRFLDYADLHAYVSTSPAPLEEREAMQLDAAYYHDWHSRYTSECGAGKPVIRGEAGLDAPDVQEHDAIGLDRDTEKLWLHNFVWSTVDSGAMGEIYWWNVHLQRDGAWDLRPFQTLSRFLADVDLNRGGYADWNGVSDNPRLRAGGQKNTSAGRMQLWIQNRASTWAKSAPPEPASGSLRVGGFRPSAAFRLEYWDTRSGSKSERAAQSDANGDLSIEVVNLSSDLAVKVYPRTAN